MSQLELLFGITTVIGTLVGLIGIVLTVKAKHREQSFKAMQHLFDIAVEAGRLWECVRLQDWSSASRLAADLAQQAKRFDEEMEPWGISALAIDVASWCERYEKASPTEQQARQIRRDVDALQSRIAAARGRWSRPDLT
jgi:hypothetical protein